MKLWILLARFSCLLGQLVYSESGTVCTLAADWKVVVTLQYEVWHYTEQQLGGNMQ